MNRFHTLDIVDDKTVAILPGKYRAQMYWNNVCPLEKANTEQYMGVNPPDDALLVSNWLQAHWKFPKQLP